MFLSSFIPWMENREVTNLHDELSKVTKEVEDKLHEKGLHKGYEELEQRYKRNARKH